MSRRSRRIGCVELERIEDKADGEDKNVENTDPCENTKDRKCSCTENKSSRKLQRKVSVFNFKEYTMQQREIRKDSPDIRGTPPKICHSDEPVRKPPPGYFTEENQKVVGNSYVLGPPTKFDGVTVKRIVVEELKKVMMLMIV